MSTGSAFVPVPRLEGPNPFRVVRRPEPTPYSCRGMAPDNVISLSQRLPNSGLPVTAHGLDWYADPRGHCGDCPACHAKATKHGVWVSMYVLD